MHCISSWALVVLLSLNSVLRAQSTDASVSGRVTDATKAVLADASIVAIRADTNARHHAITSATGDYRFTNLVPGPYRIEVEKSGFKKVIKPDVILHVQDVLTLDFELPVGSLSEAVTVDAGAPLINRASGVVSTVVDRTFVGNLPLNGRSFQSLITMTPGVVLTAASSTSPGQFSVNGQRSDANYFMVDGVSANVGVAAGTALGVQGAGAVPGLSAQGGTNSLVSVDAMQEFKIQSSSYAPEFGRTPGGQISIVTRSGTNQFHGSLFEYVRNDALDSPDYFVTRQGLKKPKEHQHDFGGVLGGPIARDRMFVFVSYEHLQLDQPRSLLTEVPSAASRAAASDSVRPTLAAFPTPNGPETAQGLARFSASYSDPSRLDATSVRVDGTVGRGLTVFARYNYAPSEASSRLGSFGIASANTVGTLHNRLHTLTSGATWIIRPTLSHEVRVNWSRGGGESIQSMDDFGGAVLLPNTTLHPSFLPPVSAYQINVGAANVLYASGSSASNVQRQLNLVEALQLTSGGHQLKVGIDYRRMFPLYRPLNYNQSYTFSGVAGLLTGTASSVQVIGVSTGNRFPHTTNFSAYAQDAWSATSKLTLTYGLRWDINPAPGLRESDEALTLSNANPTTLQFAAPGTPMYKTRWGNVAPRVGAAYRLREAAAHETVIRGGWGLFFDLGNQSAIDNLGTSFPFVARRFLANVAFPTDPVLLTPPTIAPGAPADFLVAADPNLHLPYTRQWNLALEQQLGTASTVSLSYIGAAGRRLLRQERLLNPTPQIQILTLVTNRGHSRYDALQTKYTRRLSRGIQALVSYTLAESKDNTSSDIVPVLPTVFADPEQDWGPSDFDVRHTLSGGVTYAPPIRTLGQPWSAIANGWSIDAVFVARSALPVNAVTGTTAFGVSNGLRPDAVSGVPVYMDDSTVPGDRRFNRLAFTNPPTDATGNPLRQGTLPRNALRGFAMSQVDLAVSRRIVLGRGVNLQLRAEAFNVFNQVSFGIPTNTLGSGLFGQPTRTLASSLGAGGVAGGGFSPLYQVGGPRSMQLAMRVQF